MYPVAGGTARFPHYAFGGAAGASFGWFSWLQAATVAPIEVMAVIQYGQHYSFADSWMKLKGGQHVLTANGIVAAIVLMAIFTGAQLPRGEAAHEHEQRRHLVEGGRAAGDDRRPDGHGVPHQQLHGRQRLQPLRAGGVLAAVSTSGIIFALLGFEQADQLAGESRGRSATSRAR